MNRRALSSSVAALMAALALQACVGGPASGGGEPPLTPTSRYGLQVEPGLDRIALAVHDGGLSQTQEAALADLARRFLMEGAPALVVEAPAGGDPAASAAAWNSRAVLEAYGAPAHLIQVVSYEAPDPRAPVLVGFETLRAHVPQCGTRWGALTRTADNQSASNFGCAVNANLAAQIANPRDIVQPRAMGAADAARRSVVFDLYREGEQTSALQEQLLNQRVSQAVD